MWKEDISIYFANSLSSVLHVGHVCDFHMGYGAGLIAKPSLFVEERCYFLEKFWKMCA